MTRLRLPFALLAAVLLVTACGSPGSTSEPTLDRTPRLAPASALSPELRQLSPEIQQAYRFALANPDILRKIPCYCGCGSIGHMDNYMCYVQSESVGGRVVFDYHAAG